MNLLITGAGGTVGLETLQAILEKKHNHNITVIDLPTAKRKLEKYQKNINIIYGNLTKIKDIEKIPQNLDVIIHLAAIIPPIADEKPELAYKVNVQGTKNLIENIEKYSPNATIIYGSSISVYGDRLKNPMIKVSDKLTPSQGDEYAKTKIKAENIIKKSHINWTIFRLTAVFGIKNHKIDKIMFHMPLKTPMEIITPKDAGKAFANAIDKKNELNRKIFNLSGGEKCRISYKKFLETAFKIMGLGKLKFPKIAFATQNFHCAYYQDGNDLEKILHFRNDTIETYFHNLKNNSKTILKIITKIISPIIKLIMLNKSEPYKAVKNNNTEDIKRFFGI